MHRHITYYTQSTVCQGGFSSKFLSSSSWAYAGFANGAMGARRGGQEGALALPLEIQKYGGPPKNNLTRKI